MRPVLIAAAIAVCLPASAESPPFALHVLCDNGVPTHLGISGTGRLVLDLGELYEACLLELPESKRWRTGA